MNIKLYGKAVFRVPQFPINATLEQSWNELKESIKLASADFFKLIENASYEEYHSLPPRIKLTVQKYFNRARFRATPYGTFAAVGTCNIGKNGTSQLILHTDPVKHEYTDWQITEELTDLWKSKPLDAMLLFANHSYYQIGDEIRYIYREEDYQLSDITYTPLVHSILKQCEHPTPMNKVIEAIKDQYNIESEESLSWISELIDLQLIFTNYHPNIIGEDFFHRIRHPQGPGTPKYTINERRCLAGGPDSKQLETVKQLVLHLSRSLPAPELPGDLADFIAAFSKRYDQREVPLMEALDPVIGIGYGGMEEAADHSLIIDLSESSGPGAANDWIRELIGQRLKLDSSPIIIDKIPGNGATQQANLPNTFSAILSLCDDLIILDKLGGPTGTAIHGRFTLCSPEILRQCRAIAGIESASNPDILFFDIGYTGERRVDNVNRRQDIYSHKLSIHGFDTSAEPLLANDIRVCVRNGQLILYSHRYKKRLIPRIATAYNYQRSALPLFRILCDIQHQDIQPYFIADPDRLFPDLDFIPRLQYRNIVVAPARWRLHKAYTGHNSLSAYIQSLDIPRYIRAGHADQTLVLDTLCMDDMALLQSVLHSKGPLWVQEAFIPQEPVAADRRGNTYLSELLLTFYHEQQIYTPYAPSMEKDKQRHFLPGSEWVYYELYCHPGYADELLVKILLPNIRELQPLIRHWFFIRYNDGGDHLRLRIRLKKSEYHFRVLRAMEKPLHALLSDGRIRDVRCPTYTRELERYGSDKIEAIEKHFCMDSIWVLDHIALNDLDKYRICTELMRMAGHLSGFDDSEFTALIQGACSCHISEHRPSTAALKRMNRIFKAMLNDPVNVTIPDRILRSYRDILSDISGERKRRLYTDLIHMHINRLFATDQRRHEMLLYEYLLQWCKRKHFQPAGTASTRDPAV